MMVTTLAMKMFPKIMASSVIPARVPNLKKFEVITENAFIDEGQKLVDLRMVSTYACLEMYLIILSKQAAQHWRQPTNHLKALSLP